MADRFIVPIPRSNGWFTLEDDEARHLARVRRVRVGEVVEVFDGRGFATRAEVVALGRDRVELAAVGDPLPDRVAAVPPDARDGGPQGGAVRLAGREGDRARRRPAGPDRDRAIGGRPARGQARPAPAAGRRGLQAVRAEPTDGAGPARPLGGLRRGSRTNGPAARPSGGLPAPAWPRRRRFGAVTLAIGPEGGFTDAEVETARGAGWAAIGLGATLLRIETAGLAGCSAILALCEGTRRMTGTSVIVASLVLGLVAGVLSGMFGIGGGLVIVPALIILFGEPAKTATGTSLFALMWPVGLLGVLEYWKRGEMKLDRGALDRRRPVLRRLLRRQDHRGHLARHDEAGLRRLPADRGRLLPRDRRVAATARDQASPAPSPSPLRSSPPRRPADQVH